MAPFACLFVILVSILAGFDVFPIGAPPGFQKELQPIVLPHQIVIRVTGEDRITVDGVATTQATLPQHIYEAMRRHCIHHQTMFIALYSDANSSMSSVMDVLDAGRFNGDDAVFFMPTRQLAARIRPELGRVNEDELGCRPELQHSTWRSWYKLMTTMGNPGWAWTLGSSS